MQTNKVRAEIAAPGGSYESLERAVMFGADAVYVGLNKFNARGKVQNFDINQLKNAVKLTKLYGIRLYIAFNTMIKEDEIPEAEELLSELSSLDVDGVIIADIGLIPILDKRLPSVPIHISTQAGVHNLYSAKFFELLNAERVVLARETQKEDIISIKENTALTLEYFVQGALCVSVSGRCLMSALNSSGDSGNRGGCLQPCRLPYLLSMDGTSETGFMLSPSDLSLGKRLYDLEKLGISSFKIEGRARRPEYTAQAVLSYRNLIDGKSEYADELPALKKIFNRGDYSEGYIYSDNNALMSVTVQNHKGLECGKVLKTMRKNGFPYAEVSSTVPLVKGSGLKILNENGRECGGADIHSAELTSDGTYIIPVSENVREGNAIHLTTDKTANDFLTSYTRKSGVKMTVTAHKDKPLMLNLEHGDISVSVESGLPVQKAQNTPIRAPELAERLSKLGDTHFFAESISVDADEDIFIPVSVINDLRRHGADALEKAVIRAYSPVRRTKYDEYDVKENQKTAVNICEIRKITDEKIIDFYDAVVLKPLDYMDLEEQARRIKNKRLYIALPALMTAKNAEITEAATTLIKELGAGVYADSYSAVQCARENGLRYGAGYELNIANLNAAELLCDSDFFVVSPELSFEEAKPLLERGGSFIVYGRLPVMTLAHCPVKLLTKCSCAACAYKGVLRYKTFGRNYTAVRTKANGCYFTLYGTSVLRKTDKDFKGGKYTLLDF